MLNQRQQPLTENRWDADDFPDSVVSTSTAHDASFEFLIGLPLVSTLFFFFLQSFCGLSREQSGVRKHVIP